VKDRIGRRVRLALALVACALLGGTALSACSVQQPPAAIMSATVAPPRPPIPRVCVFEVCREHVGDLQFAVIMPARWNGTLLLYVPGFYRVYQKPAGRPVAAATSPRTPVTRTMIERGFAVAGATYAWGGWSVLQSMQAAEKAYDFVSRKVGKPQRVYAWGQSMGGLASALLAQRHPDWVSGTGIACGVVGGTTRFFDSALDVGYGVRTLLEPRMRIDRFRSYLDAYAAFKQGRAAVLAAARGTPREQARLVMIADLGHAPKGTRGGPPPDPRQRVGSAVQLVVSALGFATLTRWDLESTVGGSISTNAGVDYSARIGGPEREVLERMSPGVTEETFADLAAGRRVTADQGARDLVNSRLSPTGVLSQPTVTLHDAQDQVAPLEHEGAYASLVAGTGGSGSLLQLVTAPPVDWVEGEPSPYGVGHCRFTDDEVIGLITVLNDWVTSGLRPGPDAIRADFGARNGLDLAFPLPTWPGAR
jgi:pimeloyl-ACP methyl ester carboxylesterase